MVELIIRMLICTAKKNKAKVGIYGQGPSDFPDFTQFLVEERIDSISVTRIRLSRPYGHASDGRIISN